MPGFFKPEPNETTAYHNDATHEYYGYASSGTPTSKAGWQILKIEYDTSYSTSGDPWITKWPVDTGTGLGSDQSKFIWDDVIEYDYNVLGT